jgi:hypothetical protein
MYFSLQALLCLSALKLSPKNRLGETPLHLAAVRGNCEVRTEAEFLVIWLSCAQIQIIVPQSSLCLGLGNCDTFMKQKILVLNRT